MPETPALPMCPACLRPLYLPPGYAGPLCPGHAPQSPPGAQAGLPRQPDPSSGFSPPPSGYQGGRAGGGGGSPSPAFKSKPIEKAEPPAAAKEAMADWIARFKAGKVNLPEKAQFMRLVDAQREAGLKGKVKDVIDQIPPAILYPVLIEIGQVKSEAAVDAADATSGPNCEIEGCAKPARVERKTKAGITTKVCHEHALEIDRLQAKKDG